VGVHEVLGRKQLFGSSKALDIHSAGMQLLGSGEIDQMSLDSELSIWN
jgi:hypothetical protein